MRVITIARKPLSESTVASNVLKHGCGGINIDDTRIATPDGNPHFENRPQGVSLQSSWIDQGGMFSEDRRGTLSSASSLGRWPANLILIHKAGCECVGTKRVKGIAGTAAGKMKGSAKGSVYGLVTKGGKSRWGGALSAGKPTGYLDEDGKETVANWICAEGCPVRELGEQSGFLVGSVGSGLTYSSKISPEYRSTAGINRVGHDGKGTAARFFKQIKDS